jgi:hypothetical protein
VQECFSAAEPAETAARLRHKIAEAELTDYATLLEQLDATICLPNASLAGQEARVEQAAAEPRGSAIAQLRSFLDVHTRPNARNEGATVAGFEACLRGQMAAAELTAYATIWEEADASLRVADEAAKRKRSASFDESASTGCPGSSPTLDSLPSMSTDELAGLLALLID